MNTRVLKEGEDVAKYSIVRLLVLGALKIVAGIVTGMTVVIADAINTISDVLGLFASYVGLRLSRKGTSEHFKYGYYKVETFAAFLVSVGIVYLGGVILMQGIDTFKNPVEGQFYPFAITTTIISMGNSWNLRRRLSRAAEKTNSLSLDANARDKKVDFFSGIGVLVSIVANYRGIPYVEGVITILIALIIFKEGIISTKDSLFFLLDYWDDPVLTRRIKRILGKEKDLITEVKKVRLRRSGNFIFGEAFVSVNQFAGMDDLREELELLKGKITELNTYIKDFSIYTHISKADDVRVAIPVSDSEGLSSPIASNLKKTTHYLFADLHEGKVKDHHIKKLSPSSKKPIKLVEFLKKEKINILIDNKLNSITYFNLKRTNRIMIYPHFSNIKTAKDVLDVIVIDT